MDEGIEAVVDGLPDHLPARNELSVQTMKNILEVLALSWLLGVEQLQELLDEGRSDVHLQGLDVSAIIDDQLQEEFIDGLKVGPSRIGKRFFLNTTSLTSSMPIPSPGSPCFLRMGSGRKMFFSTMLMTRSRCGMMTVDMQFWSLR